MPSVSMALQSGCDATLRRMKRRYTAEEYRRVCRLLREKFPGCVFKHRRHGGLPRREAERISPFAGVCGGNRVFQGPCVCLFAPVRTPAADMPAQVEGGRKRTGGSRQLSEAGAQPENGCNVTRSGRTVEVLLETRREELEGFTPTTCP